MQEVNFVLHQDHGDVAALVLDLSLPLLDGLERRVVRGREGYDAGLSAPIIGLCYCVKLLLAGSVPQHESDIFAAGSAGGGKKKNVE